MKKFLLAVFIAIILGSSLTYIFSTKTEAKQISKELPFNYSVIKPVTDVVCVIAYRGESSNSSSALSTSCVYKPRN